MLLLLLGSGLLASSAGLHPGAASVVPQLHTLAAAVPRRPRIVAGAAQRPHTAAVAAAAARRPHTAAVAAAAAQRPHTAADAAAAARRHHTSTVTAAVQCHQTSAATAAAAAARCHQTPAPTVALNATCNGESMRVHRRCRPRRNRRKILLLQRLGRAVSIGDAM